MKIICKKTDLASLVDCGRQFLQKKPPLFFRVSLSGQGRDFLTGIT